MSDTPNATAANAGASTLDQALGRAVFNTDGLLPAVIQQWDTGEVLMLGWMDREALRRTLTEGRVTFWSRSRQEYWRKGDTSGHAQYVKSAALDCDADALLVKVEQIGVACHTGARSCFDVDPLEPVVLGAAVGEARSGEGRSGEGRSGEGRSGEGRSGEVQSSGGDA